ncbi:hypothetical protein MBAV_004181, partial [Candidatus Magnetobacterium bavaricum]
NDMINVPSTIRIAFRALRVNKMRSALTMIGIVIGGRMSAGGAIINVDDMKGGL